MSVFLAHSSPFSVLGGGSCVLPEQAAVTGHPLSGFHLSADLRGQVFLLPRPELVKAIGREQSD